MSMFKQSLVLPNNRRDNAVKALYFPSLLDIELEVLKALNIKCIFLDIDNTIKPYGADTVDTAYQNWINNVKASGIKIILCSNNFRKTVEPIAKLINCNFVAFCLKPSPFGYIRALIKSKEKIRNTLVIGDQFFTDIFGAKILGAKAFMVDPISKEIEGTTVKIRRALTAYFTRKIINRENIYRKK